MTTEAGSGAKAAAPNRAAAEAVFGRQAASVLWMLHALVPTFEIRRYECISNEDFLELSKTDMRRGNRVYWREMLSRCHWSASLSLVRSHRWMMGAVSGYETKNLMQFSACLRGFLESSADSNDALNPIAATLAQNHHLIMKAIHGDLSSPCPSEELENRLIHFTHARKAAKGETIPKEHRAKAVTEYLSKMEAESPEIRDLYSMLCDITHPGATSVLSFATWNADGTLFYFVPSKESLVIDDVAREAKACMAIVTVLGVVPSLAILKILNELRVPGLRTTALNRVRFDGMPAWEEMMCHLRR